MYAVEAVPELSSVTWGTITEDSSAITKTKTDDGVSKTDNSQTTTITYKDVSATLDEHGYVTLKTKIAVPTQITLKDDAGLTKTNIAVRYSVNGKDQGLAKTINFVSHNVTISNLSDSVATENEFGLDLTVAGAQKAIAEDGYITGKYTIVYDVYSNKSQGYNADLSKNTAKPIASVTETVIVKVDASTLTLKDTEAKEVWNTKIASDYKATLAAPAETDGTGNTTGTNGAQDDVPPTNDVMTMALVGTNQIRYRPNVSQRIRRRQRVC